MKKVNDFFDAPILIAGQELYAKPSMGISLYPDNGSSPEMLMRKADIAMYRAKKNGSSFLVYI